jgi:translocation and assembly module TamB
VTLAAAAIVAVLFAGAAAGVVAIAGTAWGHARIARAAEDAAAARLVPGARLAIGRIDGGIGGAWTVDSVALTDSSGTEVAGVAHVAVQLDPAALFRGEVRLGTVTIRGLRATLQQSRDGTWNLARLMRKLPPALATTARRRLVLADSVALEDARLVIIAPDSLPSLPPVRRVFAPMSAHLGATVLSTPDSAGGWAPLRHLTAAISNPPVTLVSASGRLRWWSDSLHLDVPTLRLPASRAAVRGTIAWPASGSRIALDVVADSVAVPDVRWMSVLFPHDGAAHATVAVRTAPGGALRYDVREFALQSGTSRLAGSLAIIPGRPTAVRDLDVAFDPLDLALVRDIFGDTILKPAWRGALRGRLRGRGGPLDSLVLDSVTLAYDDARVPGARTWAAVTGAIDAAGAGVRLIGMGVRVDSLDVRTLGAVAKAADSLRGRLTGRLTLDGPTKDVTFHDLVLTHVDGQRPRSVVSGSGRIASDLHSNWLEATLSLDTIALATLAADRVHLPLRGTLAGALRLVATGDTLGLNVALRGGGGEARVSGTTLLDSTRTVMRLAGALRGFDAGAFVARREIPAMRVDGSLSLEVNESASVVDRHLAVRLDSTSRVGDAPIHAGIVRVGVDDEGFHLDTAEVRGAGWTVNGRGRLARHADDAGDSVTFAAAFDSLGVLRSLLLDSTGAPRFTALEGRLTATDGVLTGAFDDAALRVDLGASRVTVGDVHVRNGVGEVWLRGLPAKATGRLRGTVDSVTAGGARIDIATVAASIDHGERARISIDALAADSIAVAATGEVTWPDAGYRIRLDSLGARVGEHRWRSTTPGMLRVASGAVQLDSMVLTSDHGASVVARGSVPDAGAIAAELRVRSLGVGELEFLRVLPEDLAGTMTADARLTGTREAPVIVATARLDSLRSAERERPSLALDVRYQDRRATVTLAASDAGRRFLEAGGDIPVDLRLREVANRLPDAPVQFRLRADSASLAPFDAVARGISGLRGIIDGDVQVSGTLRRPRARGTLTLRDGAADVGAIGFSARNARLALDFAGDSVRLRDLHLTDGDSPRHAADASGTIRLVGDAWTEWTADVRSTAMRMRVVDDPRLASTEASWDLAVRGTLAEPHVTGAVQLPYGVFTIGPQKRSRATRGALTSVRPGTPRLDGVTVALGEDVRLKSRDANVQLAGGVELFGPLTEPWVSGTVSATRGTYRVNLGLIKRTFRVDSGSVILEGTTNTPAALDIWTSYTVRRADESDVAVGAHLYGTTDRPRLDLSSDLGSAVAQSEIISYLVFGKPSFALQDTRQSTMQTATAALVPSLGGLLEGPLGTLLPFFNTLQVTSRVGDEAGIAANPIDGLLNSYAVTGGRQVGSDSFVSISGGVCRGTRVASTASAPFWLGAAAEYRPKRSVGAAISFDPGPAPCARAGVFSDTYQVGFDLMYEWKFGRRQP